MSTDTDAWLARMTPGEKARLLQRVAQELGDAVPGIDTLPDICGGEATIVRTRIPVWVLEEARRLGATDATLLAAYPTLRAAGTSSGSIMRIPRMPASSSAPSISISTAWRTAFDAAVRRRASLTGQLLRITRGVPDPEPSGHR